MSPPSAPASARIPTAEARSVSPNFITEIIDRDLRSGRVPHVVTRFPPEPNGYLHIGHAKAIFVDFGLARDYGGRVHLRMDDTNPTTEDPAYVAAIERDVRWLGYQWDAFHHASDYFEQLYALALRLIEMGDAYVDLRAEATIRATRGSVSEAGVASADRVRSVAENLDLFARMRAGAFGDGAAVLRAKIDLASANMIMRDPVLYRIKHAHHYRTGDAWCLYPLYDFAHCLSDAIEGITHSLCTLEFDNNRAIYDWLVERLFEEPRPRQHEFARLQLDRTVLSKRKLITLVREGRVEGWDDPRMPTIAGIRRRGVPPEALRDFVDRVGITKANSRTDPALLAASVRDALNTVAPRVMAVLDPVELWLEDPDGELEGIDGIDAPSFPDDVIALSPEREGVSRLLPIGRRLWMEREDVALDPAAGFKRLAPGRAVRLRHAVVVICEEVEVDADGAVARVRARVVPGSLGANPAGLKVWAAIHWVDAETALKAEFRLIGDLFLAADPEAEGDWLAALNPESLQLRSGFIEASVAADAAATRYQFERQGYFWRDPGPELPGGDAAAPHDPLRFLRIAPLKELRSAGSAAKGGGKRTPQGAPAGGGAASPPTLPAGLDAAVHARASAYLQAGVDASTALIIAHEGALHQLFDAALAAGASPTAAAPWVAQETRQALAGAEDLPRGADGVALAELLALLQQGTLHSGSARSVWAAVLAGEGRPGEIVAARGLASIADPDTLLTHARTALAHHPEEVAAYRAGKGALIGFFVGAVMRASGGRADPKVVQQVVRRALDGGA
jgi:glutaminyl-tRNA synthetase